MVQIASKFQGELVDHIAEIVGGKLEYRKRDYAAYPKRLGGWTSPGQLAAQTIGCRAITVSGPELK